MNTSNHSETLLESIRRDKDSCFDIDNCFVFKDKVYECIGGTSFRVAFSEDDYDYVEDKVLIRDLVFLKTLIGIRG